MAGRRRRAAASTRTLYQPELRVLHRLDPEFGEDNEETTDPVLEEAAVFKMDGTTMANVLEMTAHGPFVVRGKLVVNAPRHRRRLLNPKLDSVYIEVSKSTQYSIGFDYQGNPCPSVWIMGESGWMEITPAREYRPIFDKMMEGITLYYRIQDSYNNLVGSKTGTKRASIMKKANIRDVFLGYARRVGDGVLFPEVEQRCDDHVLFLLDQFSKERKENFDWGECSFVTYMKLRHPHRQEELNRAQAKAIRNGVFTANTETTTPATQAQAEKQSGDEMMEDDETEDQGEEEQKATPRTSNSQSSSPNPPGHAPQTSSFASRRPPEGGPFFADLINEVADAAGNIHKHKHSKYASSIYMKCRLKHTEHKCGAELLSLYAPDLLRLLDRHKFGASPFWAWLEQEAASPPTHLEHISLEEIPYRLFRRVKAASKQANTGSESPAVLTPPSHTQPDAPRPQHAGKVPALRLASRKRPFEDEGSYESSEADNRASYAKEAARKRATPRARQASSDDSETSDTGSVAKGNNVSKIVLKSYPMQTDKPKGPRGTWVCEEDGCGHVVRSALDPEQRQLVLQHMREHTSAKGVRAMQAEQEGRLNGLPIQNLLDKILKEGKRKKERKSATLENVPERIRRAGLGW
ncbi:hypothetical protein GGTG_07326 [Gaeumannomyces tritici R3-111a-1]|uniref:DNA (cytosine-5)-methyltransferase 1 replication foci domain-containing protein n=1 Tax=Gaeumannomyces tritici (strain R3-111a-1) TaxID=644352 RepID=J3P1C9_GAET3|nr:hypothetical protein GGTG_07326 [Gaeumannomyces tritici R3-111a-1]EJT77414.1 hypothetical protein GGTG_07326 [Gaeumannomyces tritici R3-111a-1]